MPEIYNIAERFRRQQLRKERAAASEMVRAYGTIWRDVNRRINDLTREYYRAMQTGQATSTSWLYQFERLQTLRSQVEAQLAQYSRYAATTIQGQQWEALQAGTEHGYALMQEAAQGVDFVFNRLPANAIDYAVGFQQDGSPLVDVLNRYGQDAAKRLGDALIQGLALGQNPSVVARFARKQFGVALWEALRLARTETMRAYRTASLETYRANSDVVAGWVWMSARNERTCAACVTGDTIVSSGGIQKVFSRYYTGDVVVIKTARGKQLTVTPNHPVLTRGGWKAAGLLDTGDYVVSSSDSDGASLGIGINNYHAPAMIEQIAKSFGMISAEMKCASPDFHGDGIGSDVYIVRSNGLLRNNRGISGMEKIKQRQFSTGGVPELSSGGFFLPGFSGEQTFFPGQRVVSSMIEENLFSFSQRNILASEDGSLLWRSPFYPRYSQAGCDSGAPNTIHSGQFEFGYPGNIFFGDLGVRNIHLRVNHDAPVALGVAQNSAFLEFCNQALGTDAISRGDDLSGLTGKVSLDCVLEVTIRSFSGHVYNLQTETGWYSANGIITHNCWSMDGTFHKLDEPMSDHPNGRCTQLPSIKGVPLPLRDTGVEAFGKLSNVQQLKILGPAKYAAYKDGAIKLADLIGDKRSKVWGRTFYERSLKDVLGERSAYYTGLGRKVMGHTWYSTRISPGLTTVEDARFSGNQPWGWKDYENKFMELAKKRRVSILSHERTFGIWNGSVEPSNRSEVAGRKEAVKQLARDMRKLYSQDAIAVLMPRKGAEGGILRWDFGRKLTDVELNQVLGSAREISKILDIDIPLTSRSGKLEYWFKDPEGRINGRELINLTLERVGLSAVLEKPVLGYDFILIFGR